jgi:hypothetical protein
MAVIATAVVIGYDWQSEGRFVVRMDLWAGENNEQGILTQETFSVEDSETTVNIGIHAFVQWYIARPEWWAIPYDPATDTIEIINPYRKSPPWLSIQTNLMAFWKLDEDAGTPRADGVGSNDLTEVGGTVIREAVAGGYAARFEGDANTNYLTAVSNPNLASGNFDFTITFWARVSAAVETSDAPLFSSRNIALDREVFELWRRGPASPVPSGSIRIKVHNGTSVDNYNAETFLFDPGLTGKVWAFFALWYEAASTKFYLQMNNLPQESFVLSAPILSDSDRFSIGASGPEGANPWIYTGAIRRFGYWRRILTAAERGAMFNDGQGQDYPFGDSTPAPTATGTGLVHVTHGLQDVEAKGVTFDSVRIRADRILAWGAGYFSPEELTISQVLDFLVPAEFGTASTGDMIVRTDDGWVVLARGTAGQVLTMNAGGTAPEWQTP